MSELEKQTQLAETFYKEIGELKEEIDRLRKASESLLMLHLQEQEGLSQPTADEWLKAVGDLECAFNKGEQECAKCTKQS